MTKSEDEKINLLVLTSETILTDLWMSAFQEDDQFRMLDAHLAWKDETDGTRRVDVVMVCVIRHPEEGLGWVREAKYEHPHARIALVGVPMDEPVLLAYIEAGASGFIPVDSTFNEVREDLVAIYEGEAVIDPKYIPTLIDRLTSLRRSFRHSDTSGQRLEALTPRETEVLELIAHKLTNREIAQELVIEVGTVKNHVHRILEKLEFDSRYEAAAYYLSVADTQAGAVKAPAK